MDNVKPLLPIIGAIVFVLGLMIWLGVSEEREWKQYAQEHHCEQKGYESGSVGVGTVVGQNGQVGTGTVYVPGKKRYLCDGDEVIMR